MTTIPTFLSYAERLAKVRAGLATDLDPADRVPVLSVPPRPAAAPAAPLPRANAPQAPQMVDNPQAYNFGRLAEARTDVPRQVPADQVPRGVAPAPPPGIDVRSYVGSMWNGTATGPGAAQALEAAGRGRRGDGETARGGEGTMLPVGNPLARDAMLSAEFPRATRSQISGLGNMAYHRPGAFNTAVAGSRLDPQLAPRAAAQAEAALASTKASTAATVQGTAQWAPGPTPGAPGGVRYNEAIAHLDEAHARTVGIYAANAQHAQDTLAFEAATKAKPDGTGPSAEDIYKSRGGSNPQHLAYFKKEKPWSPTAAVTPAGTEQRMVPTSPNSFMPDPSQKVKDIYPDGPKFKSDETGMRWAQSGPEQPWVHVPDPTAFPTPMEWIMSGQPRSEYWKARQEYQKTKILPGPAAPGAAAGTTGQPAAAAPDKFEQGKVYQDKNGARATYLGTGKWQNH